MGLAEPRYLEPAAAVDVTDVVIQNRHLFRPSAELNDLVLGVFGRAQRCPRGGHRPISPKPAQSDASLTLGFDRQPPRG